MEYPPRLPVHANTLGSISPEDLLHNNSLHVDLAPHELSLYRRVLDYAEFRGLITPAQSEELRVDLLHWSELADTRRLTISVLIQRLFNSWAHSALLRLAMVRDK